MSNKNRCQIAFSVVDAKNRSTVEFIFTGRFVWAPASQKKVSVGVKSNLTHSNTQVSLVLMSSYTVEKMEEYLGIFGHTFDH